jgi:hypothetical protein
MRYKLQNVGEYDCFNSDYHHTVQESKMVLEHSQKKMKQGQRKFGHTPSSAVNFLRSNSASAPGAPSGITKTSYFEVRDYWLNRYR